MNISAIRKDYTLKSLEISDLESNPTDQFKVWFKEAVQSEIMEVNAMNLATVGLDGHPNSRIVLLKEVDKGFVFFTNYESEKGQEIEKDNRAALNFFWPELERQVRIKGVLEKITEKESDEYFLSRPLSSQIGAWTSPQSQKISNREELDFRKKEVEQKFENQPLHRPAFWGGYRMIPSKIEFWQGRASRLHDRICFELIDGKWEIYRLAP